MPPRSFLFYFLFDSDKLTEQSRAQLPAILDSIRRFPAPEVGVVGHTDRVGPAAVNNRLALERAEAIHDVTFAEGIEPALPEIGSAPRRVKVSQYGSIWAAAVSSKK